MSKFILQKREGRGKFRMHEIGASSQRTSAKWELRELPGLILSQVRNKNPNFDSSPIWFFSNVHLPYDECLDLEILLEEIDPQSHAGVLAWHKLQGQHFATRGEALQALEMAT